MALNQAECAVFDHDQSLCGFPAGNEARLLPGETPKILALKKAFFECGLAEKKTARASKNGVVNVEERGFDEWLRG